MSDNPYALLSGARIIELATYVAAPSAGRILADWGADIIKVEATPKGDSTRFAVPLPGMKFITYDVHNANKKSIAVNLKTPEGQEIMHKLLATANVLLTNTRATALKKLGMDYDTLHKEYPNLIHAQMTGYGETGPMANEPGFDNVCFWALGGAMIAGMEKDTAPIIPPSSFGDNGIASTMAAAVCAALYRQKSTGEGSKIVVSLYGQAIFDMTEPILSIQCSNLDKYPKSRLENTPLNNTYKCKDGKWIMVCCHEYERYFPYFMKIIGREELIHDDNINTFAKGNKNCRQVIQIISEGFSKFTRDELDKILAENDIPHAIVTNVPDLLESKQAWENKYLNEFTLPNGDKLVEAATPAKFGGVNFPPRQRAPFLGEQTSEVMKEVGYTDEQIQDLEAKGIVIKKDTYD
ncbi:CoA transferase [Caproiciproducens sp. NJN-50]|uniref:CaiB/BaiF CoA transferase family protein n=1 Tax=Acutalibacteraceae TaxID=3082771 RepID=UPI000FFE1549|nr:MULTISPECIES: CaiB/BaiF CoA-transferase family protein [Acutalibacteraceae]QAT49964.1 CoA transferase [Caproiciproducens sp. NJN-50]